MCQLPFAERQIQAYISLELVLKYGTNRALTVKTANG
jgi:hypothetical protein